MAFSFVDNYYLDIKKRPPRPLPGFFRCQEVVTSDIRCCYCTEGPGPEPRPKTNFRTKQRGANIQNHRPHTHTNTLNATGLEPKL